MRQIALALLASVALVSAAQAHTCYRPDHYSHHRARHHQGYHGAAEDVVKNDQGRPYHIISALVIGPLTFTFASGGHGWSIPFGTVQITPDNVGKWGSRHGALGLNHDDGIYDPQLKRDREGIEIHASDHLASAGCIAVAKEHFAELKQAILALIKDKGEAYLHVGPSGALITASKDNPLMSGRGIGHA